MARIFVSHSSQDNVVADELKSWLEAKDFEQIFLDFDKSAGIQPGADWEKTLYREIERSQAVIVVVTEHWMASKWCFAEFCQARALGKAIFPLIMRPTGEKIVGNDLQSINLLTDREGGMERLSSALLRLTLQSPDAFDLPPGTEPFPGLAAFDEKHAAVYFGRDAEIAKLLERLRHCRTTGGNRMSLVLGASGCGKSSFLKAGVLPRLKRDRSNFIVCPPFRPEIDPATRLVEILLTMAFERAPNKSAATKKEKRLRDTLKGASPVKALAEIALEIRKGRGALDANIVLAIDQAEEMFTRATPEETKRFFALLDALRDETLPFLVVATIRSDYLPRLQRMPDFSASYDLFPLDPMPLEQVGTLIRGPAKLVGLTVDEDVVSAIVRDAKTDDALPLIAFVLRQLYDELGVKQAWTLPLYEKFGKRDEGLSPLENAIRLSAANALEGATEEEKKAVKEAFIPAMVRLNADGNFVRRPQRLAEVESRARRFFDKLIAFRLLIARGDDQPAEPSGRMEDGSAAEETIVEVAHEALFRVWPDLKSWLDGEREFLLRKTRVELDHAMWKSLSPAEREGGLLTGILLERCLAWLDEHPRRFSAEEQSYIRESGVVAAAKANRELKQQRKLTFLSAAAAALLLVGTVGIGWLYHAERKQAEIAASEAAAALKAKNEAVAALMVAQSKDAWSEGRMEDASRLALDAMNTNPTEGARSALITAAMKISPYLETVRTLPGPRLQTIGWRSDGALAIVDRDGGLSTLDTRDIGNLMPRNTPGDRTSDVVMDVFSSADGMMGVASDGSSIFMDHHWRVSPAYDAESRTSVVPKSHAVASSAHGRFVALAAYEGVVFRECVPSTIEEAPRCVDWKWPGMNAASVALEKDGRRLAIVSDNGSLYVMSDPRSDTRLELKVSFKPAALRWSDANGMLLAADRTGNVYRLTIDPERKVADAVLLATGATEAMILEWSPRGDEFAYVCKGDRICVVPASDEGIAVDLAKSRSRELVGHMSTITKIAWSADGERLASISTDNQIRIWTRTANRDVQYALAASLKPLLSIAVDRRNGMIAAGDDAGGIWSGDGSRPLDALWPMADIWPAPVTSLGFARDGNLAALFEGKGVAVGDIKQPRPRHWAVNEAGEMHFLVWTRTGKVAVTAIRSLDLGVFDKEGEDDDGPVWPGKPGSRMTPAGLTSSPTDGQLFVSYTDGSIWRWNPDGDGVFLPLVAAEEIGAENRKTRGAHSLDVSSNGKCLVTSRSNGDVVVFNMSGKTVFAFKTADDSPKAVAFSPDGLRLAALSAEGKFYMWDVGRGGRKLFETDVSFRRQVADPQIAGSERAFAIAWLADDRVGMATEAGAIDVIALNEHSWEKRVMGVLGETAEPNSSAVVPVEPSIACDAPQKG